MMSEEFVKAPYAERAQNRLKSELKSRDIAYAELAERLKKLGAQVSERYIANKISWSSFTAAFFMMCMNVISVHSASLER